MIHVNTYGIMAIIATASAFLLFLPEMMPRCTLCGKYKFRPFFKLHITAGMRPGYSSYRSACRKCCAKFNIHGMIDFDTVRKIRTGIKSRLNVGI